MATLSPNISITLSQQRLTCVLDPSLVLSNYGLSLTQQLGEVMDLWVVRELWHILDNTRFYVQQPESVLTRAASETTADIAPAARQGSSRRYMFGNILGWRPIQSALTFFGLAIAPANPFFPGVQIHRSAIVGNL
ncbi:MAG: hypothetical protein N2235_15995 [Fischerella sp.]|nr:hypothetical protein [Fischerella sp.]